MSFNPKKITVTVQQDPHEKDKSHIYVTNGSGESISCVAVTYKIGAGKTTQRAHFINPFCNPDALDYMDRNETRHESAYGSAAAVRLVNIEGEHGGRRFERSLVPAPA